MQTVAQDAIHRPAEPRMAVSDPPRRPVVAVGDVEGNGGNRAIDLADGCDVHRSVGKQQVNLGSTLIRGSPRQRRCRHPSVDALHIRPQHNRGPRLPDQVIKGTDDLALLQQRARGTG